MRIHNASFTSIGNTYANAGKTLRQNNDRVGTGNDTSKSSSGAVIQLSTNSQFNKMIDNIQEQIRKVNENEHFDPNTKKEKIKELEKQIVELEKARVAQTTESMLGKSKEVKENSTNNSSKTQINSDGDMLELNTTALLQADNSLKNLKDAHSLKVRSEGQSRVLASEIKIDKERGVDTTRKEEQLDRINETTQNAIANMGEAIKDVNDAAQNISTSTDSADRTNNDRYVVEEDSATGATPSNTSGTPNGQAVQVKPNGQNE